MISGEPCYFIESKKRYSEYSKEYFEIIKNDAFLKYTWLSWEVLFKAGLSLEDARQSLKSRFYQNIRLGLKVNGFDRNIIMRLLIKEKGLQFKKAYLKAQELDIGNISSINKFVSYFNELGKYRNTSIEHYCVRGYTEQEATEIINNKFNSYDKTIKSKINNDPEYRNSWNRSRRPGGLASAVSNSHSGTSKFEREIISLLEVFGYQNKEFFTPVFNDPNRNNFKHDLFIENCIIEYNGRYWHKDFTKFPKFNEGDYLKEIEKAKYCIDFERSNNPNYILIWEEDFNDALSASQFIIDCVQTRRKSTFFASRMMDLELYSELGSSREKIERLDRIFIDQTWQLSQLSKCVSKQVCALVVKDGRVISTGINGTESGRLNCCDRFDKETFDPIEHHEWSKFHELHAEIRALLECKEPTNNSTLYCNLEPCVDCTKFLVASGIKRLVFSKRYQRISDKDREILLSILESANIEVVIYPPS